MCFLEKYSLYEVQVSASTNAGEGNKTPARKFRTFEDSKSHLKKGLCEWGRVLCITSIVYM